MKAAKLIGIGAVCFAAALTATSHADSDKSVTAAQFNGTWKTKNGEFKIWAVGKRRFQMEFSGIYEYKSPQGPMAPRAKAAASQQSKATLQFSNPMALKRNARSP